MSEQKKYAFLGTGNMASAIIGSMKTAHICLYDRDKQKYNAFADKPYITAENAAEAVTYADYIILSVKPQNFAELLNEIKESGCPLDGKVFVSVAAAVSIDYICGKLGRNVPVVRTIPNTPLLIGKGVTAVCRNTLVSDEAFNDIFCLFSANGKIFELPEEKMNAVIAATSSAPAYVYLFIKSITDAAAAQGINIPDMLRYIADMVIGSAEMIKYSSLSPDELIRAVTSPNGTTERAMKIFAERNFSGIIADAMNACTARAEEIASDMR